MIGVIGGSLDPVVSESAVATRQSGLKDEVLASPGSLRRRLSTHSNVRSQIATSASMGANVGNRPIRRCRGIQALTSSSSCPPLQTTVTAARRPTRCWSAQSGNVKKASQITGRLNGHQLPSPNSVGTIVPESKSDLASASSK